MRSLTRLRTVVPLTILLLSAVVALWAAPAGLESPQTNSLTFEHADIDANALDMYLTNYGSFGEHWGSGGLFFPRMTYKTLVFNAGFWIGAKVNGEVRRSISEYQGDFGPGPMQGGTFLPDNPTFHIYKVARGDTRLSNPDYADWPFDQGAPAVKDYFGNDSIDNQGFRIPLIRGTQALWAVFNDANPSRRTHTGSPLGVEVQFYVWARNIPCELGQTIFLSYTILNKGGNDLESTYVGIWADADVGDAPDDLAGCDTALSLGYCYNKGPDAIYGAQPPAVGIVLLKGPIVPSLSGSAWDAISNKWRPRSRELSMACFNKYRISQDHEGYGVDVSYNRLRGRNWDGTPIINPSTGQVTTYMVSGDPVTGSGWVDNNVGDQRILVSSGPFTMAAGDTQQIVAAVVAAATRAEAAYPLDTLYAIHDAGLSDGSAFAEVIDPDSAAGQVRRITFQPNDTFHFTWTLTELSTGENLLTHQTNQSGDWSYTTVHGLKTRVLAPRFGVADCSVSAGTQRFTWNHIATTSCYPYRNINLEGFNKSIGWASNGYPAGGGDALSMYHLKNVLLKLAATDSNGVYDPNDPNVSLAYRYGMNFDHAPARPEFAPFFANRTRGMPFQSFGPNVPLSAWDVESVPPRRLAIGFVENNVLDGTVDGRWWPPDGYSTSNISCSGPREWLWILDEDYSTTLDFRLMRGADGDSIPFMYVLMIGRDGNVGFAEGDEFLITHSRMNTDLDTFILPVPPPPQDTAKVCEPMNPDALISELRRVVTVVREDFDRVSCVCDHRGDPNFDGVIDVLDVVAIIDRVYAGSACEHPTLCPVEVCDFNGDGRTDLVDAVSSVRYAFMNGTGPANPCP